MWSCSIIKTLVNNLDLILHTLVSVVMLINFAVTISFIAIIVRFCPLFLVPFFFRLVSFWSKFKVTTIIVEIVQCYNHSIWSSKGIDKISVSMVEICSVTHALVTKICSFERNLLQQFANDKFQNKTCVRHLFHFCVYKNFAQNFLVPHVLVIFYFNIKEFLCCGWSSKNFSKIQHLTTLFFKAPVTSLSVWVKKFWAQFYKQKNLSICFNQIVLGNFVIGINFCRRFLWAMHIFSWQHTHRGSILWIANASADDLLKS